MPISFACEACQAKLKVKDEMGGKRVKCPKCGKPTSIPEAVAPPEENLLLDEAPPAPAAAPAPAPVRPRAAGRVPARPPRSETRNLIMGLVGGLVVAIVGALLWYGIAKGANAKIGWIAWGIGWGTGFGVYALSGGKGGALLSVIGAGTAVFGWLLGEYLIYSWALPDMVMHEMLGKAGKAAKDPEVVAALKEAIASIGFSDYLGASLKGLNAVFVLLAAATGWGVPMKMADRGL